jgi:hypothetical protein
VEVFLPLENESGTAADRFALNDLSRYGRTPEQARSAGGGAGRALDLGSTGV